MTHCNQFYVGCNYNNNSNRCSILPDSHDSANDHETTLVGYCWPRVVPRNENNKGEKKHIAKACRQYKNKAITATRDQAHGGNYQTQHNSNVIGMTAITNKRKRISTLTGRPIPATAVAMTETGICCHGQRIAPND